MSPHLPTLLCSRQHIPVAGLIGAALLLGLAAGAQQTQQVRDLEVQGQEQRVQLRREPAPSEQSQAVLSGLPSGVHVTLLVQDLVTGEVRESLAPQAAMIPASTTKLVTAAAVLADLNGTGGWWSTELTVPADEWGQPHVSVLTLRGTLDPTLTVASTDNSLHNLAAQAAARGIREVDKAALEGGPLQPGSWQDALIGSPMTAFMLQEWLERQPESGADAYRELHAALIGALEDAGIQVSDPAPPAPSLIATGGNNQGTEGVASVQSPGPSDFLAETLRPSDNLRAEELLATLAARPGQPGTLEAAGKRATELLRGWGVDTRKVELHDGSGLSRDNSLSARALVDLLDVMYRTGGTGHPYRDPLATFNGHANPYAEALAHAGVGGSKYGRGGTLSGRLVGSGLDVRAKTGTLPGVSSLAGYVVGQSGHPLAFAVLMNGPETAPILELRAVQDEWLRVVAAQY